MSQLTADDFIINTVRLNRFIYDRSEGCYKNVEKRKEVWKMISVTLKNSYNIEMSALAIEKRWATLRDLFGRELRKRRTPAYKNHKALRKEWKLYKPMEFLAKHYFSRGRNRGTEGNDESNSETPEVAEEEGSLQTFWNPTEDHAYACETKTDTEDTSLVSQLAEANKAISTVMSTLTKMLANQDRSEYAYSIEDAFNRVSNANKTQCLIEMLQVIKKYEKS